MHSIVREMSFFNKNRYFNKVIAVYKLPGETPLETLNRVRVLFPHLKHETLSYAGRLDPLAQGVMLVLLGKEANREREMYLGMDKTYIFDVLFGIGSDSFDPLGISVQGSKPSSEIIDHLFELQRTWIGEMVQEYPPFSSKTYKGKPLFQWTREGVNVPLPTRSVIIYELCLLRFDYLSIPLIFRAVKDKVGRVRGDFRQSEAIESWRKVVGELGSENLLPVVRFKARVSSGTYVRSLADSMGKRCGTFALALNIMRTSVGPFDLNDTVL